MSTGSTVLASGTGTLATLFWGLSTHTVIRPGVANAKALWRVCACVCACIALSAALDLDSRLLSWLRTTAKISGWYEWRRPIQAMALMAGGVCLWISLRAMLALKPHQARWPRSSSVALMACLILASLWWSRLVSWHSMDAWMNWRLYGVSLGRWIELSALCTAGASAIVEGCQRWSWR
jgi:hypothetical protein